MFKQGQWVSWCSSANGSEKSKAGRVEVIIPAKTYPTNAQRKEADAYGVCRDHESYLVRVPTKTGRGKGKLYWPRVTALKAAVQPVGYVEKTAVEKFNDVLKDYGISIGLSNDKHDAGTWEWFDKSTGEFRSGFSVLEDAYRSVAQYIEEEQGDTLPSLDDDGNLVVS